ncbi:MAG: amidohydrolase [Pseudomonadales bacterium]
MTPVTSLRSVLTTGCVVLRRVFAALLLAVAPLTALADPATYALIDAQALALEDKIVGWRRDLHEHPELSNREFRTAKIVARHLKKLGYKVTTGVAHTGVVGVLQGGLPGPVVALRADMDGLPVVERTGLDYASVAKDQYEGREVGVMHACGHDNHVAITMGAAEILAGMRKQLPGTVKIIFQPAEEGPPKGENGGARMMIEEGVLKNPDVDAIFGLHISQGFGVGQAGYRPRGAMASAQRFDVEITGRQTHGAQPWGGVDPILVGAHMVTALQSIVSRQIDITTAPAVVSVGSFQAGVRNNIIPDTASLSGTIRSFDPEVKKDIHAKIRRIVSATAESFGATAEVTIDPGVGVTYNDPALTEMMAPTLNRVYGRKNVVPSPLVTGAEDFAFYQEEIPGFFFFIGARPPQVSQMDAIPNHSPLFYVDEAALVPGVRAMASLAVHYLKHAGEE